MRVSTSLSAGLARRSPAVLTAAGPLRQAPRGTWAPRPRSHPLQSLAPCQPQPSAACSTGAAASSDISSGGSTSGPRGSAAEPAPARAPPGGAREALMRPAPPSRTGRGGVGGGSGRGMGGRGGGVTGDRGGASSSNGGGMDGGRGTGSRKPLAGRGGRAAGGGVRQPRGGWGGGDASAATDTRSAADLPSLAALVEVQVAGWATAFDTGNFFAAFNKACKLGMAPGQRPREDDPQRAALQHHTVVTLAAAYLPLVPRLPAAKWCAVPLWACAKVGYWGGGLAEALLQRLGRDDGTLMRQANDQDHANVWWSLSEAPEELVQPGGTAWEVLHASADSLLRMAHGRINSQACANVLLACARLGHNDPALLHHMTACLAAQPDANCQELANGLYALGKLREDCSHMPQPKDLQRLADAVAGRLAGLLGKESSRRQGGGGDNFVPQALSNMLMGCAKLGYAEPGLLLPLAAECKRREFAGFNAQNLANSVWAMGKLGCYSDPTWFTGAVAAAMRPDTVKTLNALDFANIWYGLALVRHAPSRALLVSTAAASEVLRAQATGQGCANLLWSLATLEVPPEPRLVGVLLGRLVELLPRSGELNGQELANSLWALAVMGPHALSRHERSVEVLLREVVRRWDGGGLASAGNRSDRAGFNSIHLTQLWRVQQTLEQADGCGGLAGIMAGGGGASSAGSLMGAMQRAAQQQGKRAGAHAGAAK